MTARSPRKARKARPARRAKQPIPKARGRKRSGPGTPPRGVVVGIGLVGPDLFCVASRFDDRVVDLSTFSMQGGGAAATMIATAASLGAKTRLFARLGDDALGEFVLRGLRALAVDVSTLNVERGRVSPVTFLQIEEDSRRRRILLSRGNLTPLDPRDLPAGLLNSGGILVIDGSQPKVQAAAAERARSKRIKVLLNADHLVGGMGELLALSDIVIGSERFANEFAPSDNIENSLRDITRIGPRVAVITLGSDGALALEGDKLVRQEGLDVSVSDTSGAGDVFCGAFAYAALASWTLERSVAFANAAAGLQCRNLGAQAGLPSLAEVIEAMERG